MKNIDSLTGNSVIPYLRRQIMQIRVHHGTLEKSLLNILTGFQVNYYHIVILA